MNIWREFELEMRDGVCLLAGYGDDGRDGLGCVFRPPGFIYPYPPLVQNCSKHPNHYVLSVHLHGSYLLVRRSASHLMDLELSLPQPLVPSPSTYSHPIHTSPTMSTAPLSSSFRSDTHPPLHCQSLRSTQRLFPLTARSARSSLTNSVSQP